MPPRSLRLEEFSDREFLFAVEDSLQEDGYATVHDIQGVLQLSHKYATNCIGTRLGYLRTVGVVEYDQRGKGLKRWTLTPDGHEIMAGKAPSLKLKPAQVVALMREINERVDGMGTLHATMLRREFRYGDAHRRRRR